MSSIINQKEYLKKYLGLGKSSGEKKKKKKKDKTTDVRLKIIDDDIDHALSQEIQEDLSALNEDAPQIVAVIDDRPPSLRIDEDTKSKLWKPIGEPTNFDIDTGLKINSFQLKKNKGSENISLDFHKNRIKHESDKKNKDKYSKLSKLSRNDFTPPRKLDDFIKIKEEKEDFSPPRKKSPNTRDSDDLSPQRSDFSRDRNNVDLSPPRKREKHEDLSPPRRNLSPERKRSGKQSEDLSPLRKRIKEEDLSPPRRNVSPERKRSGKKSEDLSPPRKREKHEDLSPPTRNLSPERRRSGKQSEDLSPPRKRSKDEDLSPPRRNLSPERKRSGKQSEDLSPPRRREKSEFTNRDSDLSPPRRKKYDVSPDIHRKKHKNDQSPRTKSKEDLSRQIKQEKSESPYRNTARDLSPPRRHKNKDLSPPRRIKQEQMTPPRQRTSRWGDRSPETSRRRSSTPELNQKTLSGKKAGLQSAKDTIKEMKALKEKEEEAFRNMSEELSGRNAATVVRGQKPKDPEKEVRDLKKEKEIKDKYDRWGKGLKQVQDESEKMIEQLNEMSKPLARYADDEDLERYLKEQEREGDPMLAYIRKKKKKKIVEAGIPEKPIYMGESLPNRFGIRPGYRWDGVDRSNGYEKKWFETRNTRKAVQEEAFRWSTEDM